jgi:hypothetical protein
MHDIVVAPGNGHADVDIRNFGLLCRTFLNLMRSST